MERQARVCSVLVPCVNPQNWFAALHSVFLSGLPTGIAVQNPLVNIPYDFAIYMLSLSCILEFHRSTHYPIYAQGNRYGHKNVGSIY